jgi:hypothetical protein
MKQVVQLQIAEPCHENWNGMTATQQGRFCLSCRKQVVDFNTMTDKEILQYLSTASSGICGRVGNDQINRDLIVPAKPGKIWWKYWMGVAASFILLSSRSHAQVKPVKPPVVCVPQITMGTIAYAPEHYKVGKDISGKVVDNDNNPVPYAEIFVKDTKQEVMADENGMFSLQIRNLKHAVLCVSSIGYEIQEVKINSQHASSSSKLVVKLWPAQEVMGKLTVKRK